jgi:hypothetical protein
MARLLEQIYNDYLADPGQLEADAFSALATDPEMLERSRAEHSSVFFHWAGLTSIAESKYRSWKHFIKNQVWPDAKAQARSQLISSGIDQPSNDRVEELTYRSAAYIKAVETQLKYGHVLDTLKKVESALWHKKSMLEVMSRRDRREQYSEPRVYETPPATKELSEHVTQSLTQPKRSQEELEAIALDVIRRNRNAG